MNDDRYDFSALDPSRNPKQVEDNVGRILAAAEPSLRARRAAAESPWAVLGGWTRPVLAAAALVAVASVGVILGVRSGVPAGASGAAVRGAAMRGAAVARSSGTAVRGVRARVVSASTSRTLLEAVGVPSTLVTWMESGAASDTTSVLDL